MNNVTKQAIERIYAHADHSFYLEGCQKDLELFDNIESSLKVKNLDVSELTPQFIWPSKEWLIDFSEFAENDFRASFTSRLKISKLAPIFYIQHEFSVINKVPAKIEPSLDGYSGMPYIMLQYEFQEDISKTLEKNDYLRLKYSEIYEVIPELSFPQGVTIFGPQVTVEYALFHDLLDLCPDNDAVE